MPESASSTDTLADSIMESIETQAGPAALSSENSPVRMTVDGRVERLRDDEVPDKGSCNPPWSAWSD